MDLWPGNGPHNKSVSSEERPLGGLTTGGSLSQAGDTRKWFLQKDVCPCGLISQGLARGLSQLWLNKIAFPSGRRPGSPSRPIAGPCSHPAVPPTSPHPGFAG